MSIHFCTRALASIALPTFNLEADGFFCYIRGRLLKPISRPTPASFHSQEFSQHSPKIFHVVVNPGRRRDKLKNRERTRCLRDWALSRLNDEGRMYSPPLEDCSEQPADRSKRQCDNFSYDVHRAAENTRLSGTIGCRGGGMSFDGDGLACTFIVRDFVRDGPMR